MPAHWLSEAARLLPELADLCPGLQPAPRSPKVQTWPGANAWSTPGGVRELLYSRLAAVSETGWQLLNTAAVIGRSFDFETLRKASGRSKEETVTGLEELLAQGLVREASPLEIRD